MITQRKNTFFGLSTDTKPSGVAINGRRFIEIDTGDEYRYNAAGGAWVKQPAGGGSSALSGLNDVDIVDPANNEQLLYSSISHKWENSPPSTLFVGVTYDESTGAGTLSETWQALYDAIADGILVYIADTYEDEVIESAYLGLVREASHYNNTYAVLVEGLSANQSITVEYTAASANDYPVASGD